MIKKALSLSLLRYNLPQEKIALYPANPRHSSKLLVYKNSQITETTFDKLSEHIPENATLVFNNSKVIPARLVLHKESGAKIEIFCLEKYKTKTSQSEIWECFVGGVSKWKNEQQLAITIEERAKQSPENIENCQLNLIKTGFEPHTIMGLKFTATLLKKHANAYLVQFEWNKEIPFYDVLEIFGSVPLPPYVKRATEARDKQTYQTVYSEHKGSVAAPTAGLHFSEKVFTDLAQKNIQSEYVTLHVGAGTFKPIKTNNVYEHEMHHEWIDVSVSTIEELVKNTEKTVIPVGTTSLRTLESLYWLGIKIHINGIEKQTTELLQWEDIELDKSGFFTAKTAFETLLHYCLKNDLKRFTARTQIMITPEYKIRTAKAILTNFHQPESSLLLLISAFVGEDWKTIYDYALSHDFRFLSYGDSSLLWLPS